MHRELIPLYGSLAINSFGFFIILGLLVFSIALLNDPKRPKLITIDQYYNTLSLAIIVALIGGRLLYVFGNWQSLDSFWEIFFFWQGGFSLLGGVLALLLVLPLYFKRHGIPIIAFLDLIAIYAPLLQSIARIGCFCAGCCFGLPAPHSWCMPLHPTQLYSAAALFVIFLAMFFYFQRVTTRPGQLLCIYLVCMGLERFIIDFWRGDRIFLGHGWDIFSLPQWIAVSIAVLALVAYCSTFLFSRARS